MDNNIRKQIIKGIDRMEGLAGVGKLFRKHIPKPWRDVIVEVACEYYDSDYVEAGTKVGYLALGLFDGYIPPPPPRDATPISQQTARK